MGAETTPEPQHATSAEHRRQLEEAGIPVKNQIGDVNPTPGVAEHVADSHDPGRPFAELLESGLLWLINTSVFHPRGLALAVSINQETGEASGWSLLASEAGTAYRYAAPCEADDPSSAVDVDELFQLASATMEQARLTTWGA